MAGTKNMKSLIMPIFMAIFFLNVCYAANDSLDVGQKILRQIEPHFLGTPLYLNPDQKLKAEIEKKLFTAIDYLGQAANQNPNDSGILFLLGKAYSFAHDLDVPGAWQKSTEYLEKCIELDPTHLQAHFYLAKNYSDAERFTEAYDLYKIANTLDPTSEAQKFMAYSLMFQKKTPEAITAMHSYVDSHPQDREAHNALEALKRGNVSSQVISANDRSSIS